MLFYWFVTIILCSFLLLRLLFYWQNIWNLIAKAPFGYKNYSLLPHVQNINHTNFNRTRHNFCCCCWWFPMNWILLAKSLITAIIIFTNIIRVKFNFVGILSYITHSLTFGSDNDLLAKKIRYLLITHFFALTK